MSLTKVMVTEYDVTTKTTKVYEKQVDMPNPRISEIEQRLQEIRAELSTTDYKAIKYAEGQYTNGKYDATKAARAALRAEYNALEVELSKTK